MTRDDIIRMAREAGGHELMRIDGAQDSVICITGNNAIICFAALVAAAEREECAKVCEAEADFMRLIPTNPQYQDGRSMSATVCANKIRARGQA